MKSWTNVLGRHPATGLFLIFLAAYAYFFPRWADWNQNSRFALVQALVEERTFVIDNYYQWTGDYALYRGHRYSDKAPGLSFLGAPVYMAFREASYLVMARNWVSITESNPALVATLRPEGTGLREDKVERAAALYVVTFFTVSLPSALLWLLVFCFLGDIGVPRRTRMAVALATGLGTVAFPYATVFYSHQTGAFLLFSSFYLLFRIRLRGMSPRYLWAIGALLGLAVVTDYPSLLPAGLLLLYAASFLSRRVLLARVVVGALPSAAMLAFYNYVCFDSPFASSYRYLALFQEQSNYGVMGFSLPNWQAFWGISFSPYRGLFFSSPFLLAALPGVWLAWRSGRWRSELLTCISVMTVYLILISSYYDWKGGFSVAGPRNLIPMIPFTALPLVWGFEAAWRSSYARPLLAAAMAWSLGVVFIQTVAGQAFAPIAVPNPLFDFFLPRLLKGDINRNFGMVLNLPGWYSLIPLLAATALISTTLWAKEGRASDR